MNLTHHNYRRNEIRHITKTDEQGLQVQQWAVKIHEVFEILFKDLIKVFFWIKRLQYLKLINRYYHQIEKKSESCCQPREEETSGRSPRDIYATRPNIFTAGNLFMLISSRE
ncbi:hypothetical protein HNY73_001114 [Argiope bruennichi]|uniref:Uncharacterized protein n=1 Tax=Argiope bruennichi TaxID=94029 RepID=A0A8T0G0A9_ARGBR|nr:hypothetical protein HNY73_001114 [Argiope bruennichi]